MSEGVRSMVLLDHHVNTFVKQVWHRKQGHKKLKKHKHSGPVVFVLLRCEDLVRLYLSGSGFGVHTFPFVVEITKQRFRLLIFVVENDQFFLIARDLGRAHLL
jgi:hypothetical protein